MVASTKSQLTQRLTSPLIPPDLAEAASDLLAGLPDGDRVCHGDFHPDNVLVEGGHHFVIDWTNLSRGDPCYDVARTQLLVRWGQPPHPLPFLIRLVDRRARVLLMRSYMKEYQRKTKLSLDLIDRWHLVVAIARLAEGIEGEAELITAWSRKRLGSTKR